MKIQRNLPAFHRSAPVSRALVLGVHADGTVSLNTDLPGGTVSVEQNEDGTVLVQEIDADGNAGEALTIAVVAPPAEEG